jgi:hypothetical protein
MLPMRQRVACIACALALVTVSVGHVDAGDRPRDIARQIDEHVNRQLSGPQTSLITESAFIRRVTLDLAGRIPTVAELEAFRESESLNKRAELVQRLIDSPDFAFHQRNQIDTLLLRRLEHNDQWRGYLLEAAQQNRPWDQLFREVMLPEQQADDTRPAMFLRKRLGNLDTAANDSSIIWFGVNVACAKCHDHPLVDDWKQAHYYGMASFFKRTFQTRKGSVGERFDGRVKYNTTEGEEFEADFMFLTGTKVDEPELDLDEKSLKEYREAIKQAEKDDKADPPPRPEFSPRAQLVDLALADADQEFFARNIANRIWARMFGRGLVHPLDQMHSENPPSHPELLALLAEDLKTHGYNLKRLLQAIALSDTYARPLHREADGEAPLADTFANAVPRPLSPHQLSLSLKIATSSPLQRTGLAGEDDWAKRRDELERQSEGVARQIDIPDDGFQVPVTEALWFSNNAQVQNDYLNAGGDRLVGYLEKIESDEQLVLRATQAVLSRDPHAEEQSAMMQYLNSKSDRRVEAIRQIVWALLSSPEFRFNR